MEETVLHFSLRVFVMWVEKDDCKWLVCTLWLSLDMLLTLQPDIRWTVATQNLIPIISEATSLNKAGSCTLDHSFLLSL